MMESEEDFLFQNDLQQLFSSNLESENWTIAYHSFKDSRQNGAFFSAFIPNKKALSVLQHYSWDLKIGGGCPGISVAERNGKEIIKYHHYTENDNVQPIVLVRNFHNIRPQYTEIQEEFRLYHNLYQDATKGKYIKIHDDGNEEDIILVEDKIVQIRTKALRQYAAIKDMSIALFVDSVRYSPIALEQIEGSQRHLENHNDRMTYFVEIKDCTMSRSQERRTLSRFLGKWVIKALPKEKCGIWPSDQEEEKYESFIIGSDEDGDPITYSCDPDKLEGHFGAKPGAPHYLTLVYFRKEVLNKYYAQPQKYEVRDGQLYCGGLWCLRMDNDHSDYVVVYLGDLGGDLPESERTYWKAFNTHPLGGMSKTCYSRGILGQFAEPESPDLRFKQQLSQFKEVWEKKHKWPLLLELDKGDQHLLTALHLPTTDDQAEFDNQVLALTKILVDSLNETELAKRISRCPDGAKGIDKLELFLRGSGNPSRQKVISFLRDLQALRSTGVGHRKGKKYEKIAQRFSIESKNLKKVFYEILIDATAVLSSLNDEVENPDNSERDFALRLTTSKWQ